MIYWLIGILFAVSCAQKSARDLDPGLAVDLMPRAQEILSASNFCENQPVYDGPNRVSGREACNGGDSMLWSGLLYYAWPDTNLGQAIRGSIAESGKPFRSPEHRRAGDNENEFSRDMFFGFLFYCLKSGDVETCQRVVRFAVNSSYQLCGGSPSQCALTPGMLYATYSVWNKHGWALPSEFKPNIAEQGADAAAAFAAAKTVPEGYQLHLISLKVFLYHEVGLLGEYRSAARALVERQPSNVWYQFVGFLAGTNSEDSVYHVKDELRRLMDAWHPGGSDTDWFWQGRRKEASHGMGSDFVFLACLLNKGCSLTR